MFRFKAPGFSLLELLVALSIVAILASISVPSYSGFVAKARRSDAVSALLQLQLAEQRWRAANASYANDPGVLGWRGDQSPDGYYRIQIERGDAADFLGKAIPRGAQQADTCGTFAINSQGPVDDPPYANAGCWNR